MEFLKLQIPPFIRIDLFEVILTQALSIGKFLGFAILCILVWNAVTMTFVSFMRSRCYLSKSNGPIFRLFVDNDKFKW